MRRRRTLATTLVAGSILAGCGSSSATGGARQIHLATSIAVPNVTTGMNFSFDISAVDSAGGRYYLADRNNKGIDVIDIKTNSFIETIKGGFAGCMTSAGAALPDCAGTVDNSRSGPDGVIVAPGSNFIYVGDVNAVQVVDKTNNTVVKTIAVSTSGLRADEGCFDSDDNLLMISSPEETPPFATFIDTTTQAVVAKVTFTDVSGTAAAGLEQCGYDPGTHSFYVNNDGTTANPHGELDVFPAAAIRSTAQGATVNYTTLSGVKMYSEGNCDPTGLAFGPGNDLAIDCRPGTVGAPMNVLIVDRTTGATLATINAGGGDQLAYDAVSNLYLIAASRWNASGKTMNVGAACTAANACTPMLTIIDAASRALVDKVPTGNNAHSVGVDGATHQVYLPYSSGSVPAGAVTGPDFARGGISVVLLP
jgi:hypothetical protein